MGSHSHQSKPLEGSRDVEVTCLISLGVHRRAVRRCKTEKTRKVRIAGAQDDQDCGFARSNGFRIKSVWVIIKPPQKATGFSPCFHLPGFTLSTYA